MPYSMRPPYRRNRRAFTGPLAAVELVGWREIFRNRFLHPPDSPRSRVPAGSAPAHSSTPRLVKLPRAPELGGFFGKIRTLVPSAKFPPPRPGPPRSSPCPPRPARAFSPPLGPGPKNLPTNIGFFSKFGGGARPWLSPNNGFGCNNDPLSGTGAELPAPPVIALPVPYPRSPGRRPHSHAGSENLIGSAPPDARLAPVASVATIRPVPRR